MGMTTSHRSQTYCTKGEKSFFCSINENYTRIISKKDQFCYKNNKYKIIKRNLNHKNSECDLKIFNPTILNIKNEKKKLFREFISLYIDKYKFINSTNTLRHNTTTKYKFLN